MAFAKNKTCFKNSLLNRLAENAVKSIENLKFRSAVQELFCTAFCIYVYFLLCYIVLVLTKAKGEIHMTSAQIIIVVTIVLYLAAMVLVLSLIHISEPTRRS